GTAIILQSLGVEFRIERLSAARCRPGMVCRSIEARASFRVAHQVKALRIDCPCYFRSDVGPGRAVRGNKSALYINDAGRCDRNSPGPAVEAIRNRITGQGTIREIHGPISHSDGSAGPVALIESKSRIG